MQVQPAITTAVAGPLLPHYWNPLPAFRGRYEHFYGTSSQRWGAHMGVPRFPSTVWDSSCVWITGSTVLQGPQVMIAMEKQFGSVLYQHL